MRVTVCRFTPYDGGEPFPAVAMLRRATEGHEIMTALIGPSGVMIDQTKGTTDMAGETKGEFVFDEYLPIRDIDLDINQP